MKHSVIYMAMAAIALASCSTDETSEVNRGNSIEFRTAIGTRAEAATVRSCWMTAVDAYDDYLFSMQPYEDSDGSGILKHPNGYQYYWPADGTDITFYAFSPTTVREPGNGTPSPQFYLGNSSSTVEKSGLCISNFYPRYPFTSQGSTSDGNQYDLLGVVQSGNKNSNTDGITLTFKHLLSCIDIQAMSSSTAYDFEVAGWKLANVQVKGTYDLTDPNAGWTFAATPETYTYTYLKGTNGETKLTDKYQDINFWSMYMIPQQLVAWNPETDANNGSKGAYLALRMRITSKSTGSVIFPTEAAGASAKVFDWIAVPLDTNWQVGKKYIYKLDFSNGAGNVAPDVDDSGKNPGGLNPGDEVMSNVKISFVVNEIDDWQDASTGGGSITM